MNRRGQTLVFFIILIPFILGCMAFVVDMGVITYRKSNLQETIKTVIKDVYKNDKVREDAIKELLKRNKIDDINLEIILKDEEIRVKKEDRVQSIFGNIIGIKDYKIKIDITGYKDNDKVFFK